MEEVEVEMGQREKEDVEKEEKEEDVEKGEE